MTATIILKEIHALPAREKNKLFKRLADECDPLPETSGRVSEKKLLRFMENIGLKQRTKLTAAAMSAARLEGQK